MCHQAIIISSHVNADAEQKTKDEDHPIGLIGLNDHCKWNLQVSDNYSILNMSYLV